MLTRRRVLRYSALAPAMAPRGLLLTAAQTQNPLRLAIIGNTYHYGSDLQISADRFLVGYPHDGDWHMPNVRVVSVYVESSPRAGQERRSGQRAQAERLPP